MTILAITNRTSQHLELHGPILPNGFVPTYVVPAHSTREVLDAPEEEVEKFLAAHEHIHMAAFVDKGSARAPFMYQRTKMDSPPAEPVEKP